MMSIWVVKKHIYFLHSELSVKLLLKHSRNGICISRPQYDVFGRSLPGVGAVCHLLEAVLLHLVEAVPPHGALVVELLDFPVDQLVGVLALVMLPTRLNQSTELYEII